MLHFKPILGASALALLCAAPAAFADVSASDVWTQWKDQLSRSGQTFTVGEEHMMGDTLMVNNLTMAMETPEMSYSVTIPTLGFKENGDGTVSVEMYDQYYPIELKISPEGEEPVSVTLAMRQTGLAITASGTPEALSYDYSAEELSVDIDKLVAPDSPDVTLSGGFRFGGVVGTYDLTAGDVQDFVQDVTAAMLDVTFEVNAPSEGGAMTFTMSATDLGITSEGGIPADIDYADMAAAISAGFSVMGKLSYSNASYAIDFKDGSDTFAGKGSSASESLEFWMSADGLSYIASVMGFALEASGSAIPLPSLSMSAEELGFGVTMPIVQSATPQNVGLVVRLVKVAVQEELWSLIDPTGQLSHDPATLIVDIKGTANWLVDLLAPDAAEQMAGSMPGELHTLDIDELELTAAGTSLTGAGGFVFDNSDLMTWGGLPAPEGVIDLTLSGANTLIDNLVAMGLIPEDQAMGTRMMLGMFAKPGDGPDTLTSKIEVTKDGHIFANGQQLQ